MAREMSLDDRHAAVCRSIVDQNDLFGRSALSKQGTQCVGEKTGVVVVGKDDGQHRHILVLWFIRRRSDLAGCIRRGVTRRHPTRSAYGQLIAFPKGGRTLESRATRFAVFSRMVDWRAASSLEACAPVGEL